MTLPRGMRDFDPEDYELLEEIRSCFMEVSKLYGFRVMEPSPIEMASTLEAKSGPEILNEIYHFEDRSGRSVALRFDLTVGMTRYVASHRDLQLPVKLGAFSGMWRYDEPQFGRYRWFHQWDAEIFGCCDVESDAEVIDFTSTLLRRLKLGECVIEIGDRRVVEEFIRFKLGVNEDSKVIEMLRALDKVGKKSVDEILDEYGRKGVKKEWLQELIRFGGVRGEPDDVLSSLSGLGLNSRSSLAELTDTLEARGVGGFYLNIGVVRGLDYYNGIVFEAFDKENLQLGALAGGGRYDSLPAIFGRSDIGATGVAGGVERTMIALSKKGGVKGSIHLIYVAYAKPELMAAASQVASKLRLEDVSVDLDLSKRSLRRQMEVASSMKVRYVLIVAPREYSEGKLVLRDMESGEESLLKLDEVASFLKTKR